MSLADTLVITTASLPPRLVIHGQEGVGKTTIAAATPAPVFIRTEDGCPAGLTFTSFPFCETYTQVRDALMALAKESHDFRTLVIDSLDPLEALIWRDVCATHSWNSIEQPGFGKGYVVVDKWWQDMLAAFDFLRRERGMMVILLAHSAIERVDDPRAASYTSYQLRLHKRARGLIQDWADAIGFLALDLNIQSEDVGFNKKRTRGDGGSTRWLQWEARPSFVAKNRYGLPAKMMVPKDFDFEKTLAPYFPTRGKQ
jgi:hypothetical protein